jgi:hypothetical protein
MNLVHPGLRVLTAQGRALLRVQLLRARVAIDQKQRIHQGDHRDRRAVFRIHFHGVRKLAPRVGPTADVHQFQSADIVVGRVSIGL